MNRPFSSRPVRRLLAALVLVAALCGCISQPRTPYNEYGAFSDAPESKPGSTVNLWPLYNSDGRSHYVAWPLIKCSPGCFAFLPFYNYDHGIHDVALLATLVPHTGEYRLLPFFFRTPQTWVLFPLAYRCKDWGYGSPLLFNVNDRFVHVFNTAVWSGGACVFPLLWVNRYGDRLLWTAPMGLVGGLYDGPDARRTRVHWAILLWFSWCSEGTGERVALTPLAAWGAQKDGRFFNIGPFGFPFPFHYGRFRDVSTDALLPLWFSRRYPDDGGGILLTPLFGYGKNAEAGTDWWFVLTAGRAADRDRTTGWFLPFWLASEGPGESRTWTPFSYCTRYGGSLSLQLGPLGIGWPYFGERKPLTDSDCVFPLFHRRTSYYAGPLPGGEGGRTAFRSGQHTLLCGLLWKDARYAPSPDDPPRPSVKVRNDEGWEWSFATDLLAASDLIRTDRRTDEEGESDVRVMRTRTFALGWLLWRSSRTEDCLDGVPAASAFFTPLCSRAETDWPERTSKTGLLLDALVWRNAEEDGGRSEFDFLWCIGARYRRTSLADDLTFLGGILWDSYTDPSETWKLRFGRVFSDSEDRQAFSADSLLLGTLWHSATFRDAARADSETLLTTRTSLFGALYWERIRRLVRTCSDGLAAASVIRRETAVLTPLVWSSKADLGGTFSRRILCGLLHDYTRDQDSGAESFGILGFLYRSVRTPEGAVARSCFPFVTVGDDGKGTSYFSFLHRLLRVETTPEGRHVWLFWFKVS